MGKPGLSKNFQRLLAKDSLSDKIDSYIDSFADLSNNISHFQYVDDPR
jgi:hypothetical protein